MEASFALRQAHSRAVEAGVRPETLGVLFALVVVIASYGWRVDRRSADQIADAAGFGGSEKNRRRRVRRALTELEAVGAISFPEGRDGGPRRGSLIEFPQAFDPGHGCPPSEPTPDTGVLPSPSDPGQDVHLPRTGRAPTPDTGVRLAVRSSNTYSHTRARTRGDAASGDNADASPNPATDETDQQLIGPPAEFQQLFQNATRPIDDDGQAASFGGAT
jgi:hypothetical protein